MVEIVENLQIDAQAEHVGKIAILVAWPYANGPRHLGHGASLVPGDVLARYFRSRGADVLMVSGTDEHGTPNAIAAEAAGMEPADYVTQVNDVIRKDFIELGMSFDWFTRTSTAEHAGHAQELFTALTEHGFIEKGSMLGAFDSVTDQSLPDRYVEGECPHCAAQSRGDQCEECTTLLDPSDLINPVSKITGNEVEFKESEHYFLMLDKLAPDVASWLQNHQSLRSNAKAVSEEMAKTLRPRAITRDMSWGVPLPEGYDLESGNKVLYVWFEAVIGYLSASMEWAKAQGEPDAWKEWWFNDESQHHYVMGKDNVPFHTIVWPAIISGARKSGYEDLHLPDNIASTEYLTFNEGKFSSSRGNTVYVSDMLSLIGPDSLRYYLLSAGPETSDVTFSFDQLTRRVNDELIAKWGNLVSRTVSLLDKNHDGQIPVVDFAEFSSEDVALLQKISNGYQEVGSLLEASKFSQGVKQFMALAGHVNKYLYDAEPWKTVKINQKAADRSLFVTVAAIQNLATIAAPFLPHSSQKIHTILGGEDTIASQPVNHPYKNGTDDLTVLTGDYNANKSRWHFTMPKVGKAIVTTSGLLFQKIDEAKLIEEFNNIVQTRAIGRAATQ